MVYDVWCLFATVDLINWRGTKSKPRTTDNGPLTTNHSLLKTVTPFDAVSPFDARYYFADADFYQRLHPFVSEAAQIRYLARVEAALAETLADFRVCPRETAAEIVKACDAINPDEVYEEERRIQHNIRALVNCIGRRVSPNAQPYVHLFATSADIMDTARALCLVEATRSILVPDLVGVEKRLIDMARAHAGTPQMGR